MIDAVATAMARARCGLDWSYPCLMWVADYLRDATGTDFAVGWRAEGWTEWSARRALLQLAGDGEGATLVERVIDAFARTHGWAPAEAPMQGAVMIGVYDGIDLDGEPIGVPAIFDGSDRWVLSNDGKGVTVTGTPPRRMWEIVV